MIRILAVTGASGTGKTLATGLMARGRSDVLHAVTATTRPPRPGEHDGVDYWFVSEQTFERALREGGLVAPTAYMGHRYAIPVESLLSARRRNMHVAVVVDAEGARRLQELFPGQVVAALLATSDYERRRRLRRRDGLSAGTSLREASAEGEVSAIKRLGCTLVDAGDPTATAAGLSGLLP